MNLILGASGFIGRALRHELNSRGRKTVGTYYPTATRPDRDAVYLDLARPDLKSLQALGISQHLFICTQFGTIDDCKREPHRTREINVNGVVRILDYLGSRGIIPVYFSSDLVFDGQRGHYQESDAVCPITEYGRQKAAVEAYISKHFSRYLIIRLTKVYGRPGHDSSLIGRWYDTLRRGHAVLATVDLTLAPLFIDDVVKITADLVLAGQHGIFHLSGPEEFTAYELALRIARRLGCRESQVQATTRAALPVLEPRPAYHTLNTTKLARTLTLSLTTVDRALASSPASAN